MLDTFYRKLYDRLNWLGFSFLLIGFIVCNFLFYWRIKIFDSAEALDGRFPNGDFWYSPPDVVELFSKLAHGGNLNLYFTTELSLDLIFPVIYFLLLTFLIVRLFQAEKAKYLLLIPFAAALADVSENFTIAYLISTFDIHSKTKSPIAYLAATFSLTKWVMIIASLLVIIFGAMYWFFKRKSS